MAAPVVCRYTDREAFLSGEFGEAMARRYFSAEVIDALPRYVRGKNAGKIKAKIQWRKCERGGWNYSEQRVERRVGKVISVTLLTCEWKRAGNVLASWDEAMHRRPAPAVPVTVPVEGNRLLPVVVRGLPVHEANTWWALMASIAVCFRLGK